MTKRRAFVGFSTPFGYDYTVHTGYGKGNPILEAPTGLLILYDEIWFPHEDVCPINLRDKEFIHFLQDMSKEPTLYVDKLLAIGENKYEKFEWNWNLWHEIVKKNAVEERGVDQHHRPIEMWDMIIIPRSDSLFNTILDCSLAAFYGIDIITNSVIANSMENKLSKIVSSRIKANYLVEEIISKRIPCFQSKDGPYIEYIDDLRKSKYIKDFRCKIESVLTTNMDKSVIELSEDVEHEFNEFRNACLKRSIDKKKIFSSSIVEFILKPIASTFPGIELIKNFFDIIISYKNYKEADMYQWTGFIAELELKTK